jgi:GWxTD domain-containing protein
MHSFNHKISILILVVSVFITAALGNVEVDYAVFKGNQDVSIVEVYYSMPRDMFDFKKIEDTDYFQSKILIRTIFSKEDSVVNWKQWTLVDNLTDTTINMRGQLIPDVRSFQLPPDDYEISVIVGDRITGEKKTVRENIKVDSFPKGELAASDLCLATHIQKTNKENKFSKYFGYDLIPSANLIFGEINPVIYPYYEIYNMQESGSKRYLVKYSIEDADGEVVREVDWITKKKPGKTAVEVYLPGIKTKGLASGSYDLISRVIDRANKDSVELNKQIFIVNVPRNQYTGMNMNRLKGYNEAQLDSIYGPMKYIATRKEKQVYKDLSPSGKRKFLANFWKDRDPNPKTVVNEAQRNFENLVILANNKFSHGSKDGWETDRGRILLKYGRPDEIDRHESSIDKKPYRIWIYHDVQGGVKFVFVDIEGFSRYELVHSNARNELHDNNWQRYIEMTQF